MRGEEGKNRPNRGPDPALRFRSLSRGCHSRALVCLIHLHLICNLAEYLQHAPEALRLLWPFNPASLNVEETLSYPREGLKTMEPLAVRPGPKLIGEISKVALDALCQFGGKWVHVSSQSWKLSLLWQFVLDVSGLSSP